MECDGCRVCRGGWPSLSTHTYFWQTALMMPFFLFPVHLLLKTHVLHFNGNVMRKCTCLSLLWKRTSPDCGRLFKHFHGCDCKQLMNIHPRESIQMAALAIGSMCKRWSDSSSGQEASRASLHPSPWLPRGLHLQHQSVEGIASVPSISEPLSFMSLFSQSSKITSQLLFPLCSRWYKGQAAPP